jgi:hypothetical protein
MWYYIATADIGHSFEWGKEPTAYTAFRLGAVETRTLSARSLVLGKELWVGLEIPNNPWLRNYAEASIILFCLLL